MGVKWQTVALENLANEVTVGFVGSMTQEYVDDGIPFLRSKNINEFRVNWDDIRYIAKSFHEKIKKSKLAPGDVVIVRTGKPGVSCVIPESLPEANCSDVVIVRVNRKVLNEHFFCYFMNSNAASHVSAHLVGAVQQHFNVGAAKKLMVPVPSIEEQNRIVNVLKTIDDRIGLNRQMNETLEQMAQALFKSWFVDFDPVIDNALDAGNPIPEELEARAEQRRQLRNAVPQGEASVLGMPDEIRSLFPSEFELTDEKGWVPKGWSVQPVLSLIELTGGGTPKTTVDEYWDGDIPWFSVVDAPAESDVFVIDTEKHVTQEGIDNSSTKLLRPGTTIISARGTVGKCALVAAPMTMNQSCYAVNGMDGLSDEFVYYLVRYQVGGLQQRSHGSVFSTITRDTFKSIFVASPGAKLTQAYSDYVRSLFDKILSNSKSTTELGRTRDLLLPKLISGELQIPDAEQQIAEVLS